MQITIKQPSGNGTEKMPFSCEICTNLDAGRSYPNDFQFQLGVSNVNGQTR
jgi:hypothetical protein